MIQYEIKGAFCKLGDRSKMIQYETKGFLTSGHRIFWNGKRAKYTRRLSFPLLYKKKQEKKEGASTISSKYDAPFSHTLCNELKTQKLVNPDTFWSPQKK